MGIDISLRGAGGFIMYRLFTSSRKNALRAACFGVAALRGGTGRDEGAALGGTSQRATKKTVLSPPGQ